MYLFHYLGKQEEMVLDTPLQMRNLNVKTPSSLWTFHHAVPSPSFSTWELSVTENQCQSVCGVCVPLVITRIHLDCLLFFFSRGTVYPTEVTVQRRGFCGGTDITGDVQ